MADEGTYTVLITRPDGSQVTYTHGGSIATMKSLAEQYRDALAARIIEQERALEASRREYTDLSAEIQALTRML